MRRMRAASVGWVLVLIISLAACADAGTGAHRQLDVTTFGAHSGDADDTAAIQRALDALRAGDELVFPPGTYRHSAVLTASVADVTVAGKGATLLATDEAASAFRINADRVTVEDLTFAVSATTKRWSATEQHKIWISGHTGVVLRGVTVAGSAAAGVFVDGAASDFRIDHVTVRDTRADGIHITDGATRGTIDHPVVSGTGDDGVAVVSYDKDPAPCSAIDVISPRVLGTTWGRGVTVVGGHDIVYSDVYVENSNAAGIYVASEGSPWFTRSVDDVAVRGGRVVGANVNTDIDQGAVVVFRGRPDTSVSQVQISGVTVENTRATASRNVGIVGTDGAAPTAVVFSAMKISGGPGVQYGGNVPASSYRVVP